MNTELILSAREYCKSLMANSRCSLLPFHNWQHTVNVVSNARLIGEQEAIEDEKLEEIIIASYFHDTGNTVSCESHEQRSCENAIIFLNEMQYPQEKIDEVISIIKATVMPQQPQDIYQKIICDADLAHLGKANFFQQNKNLRMEWALYNDLQLTDGQWLSMNINFLKNHSFHTSFAREYYGKQKDINLEKLESLIISQA